MAERQGESRRVSTTGAAAVLKMPMGAYPAPRFELFAETSTPADLVVEGSIDDVEYRETFRLAIPGGETYQNGFSNSYRYVRVSFSALGDQTLELAAGGR